MPQQVPPLTELPLDVRAANAAASALFVLAALLFVGLGLTALARLPAFTLRVVQIDGDVTRNNAVTIRAHVVSQLTGNFFSVSLERTRQAFQAVPWVRHAVVRRVWPNALAVTIEEHHAAAIWEEIAPPRRPDEAADPDALEPPRRAVSRKRARIEIEPRLVNTAGEVFDANLGDVDDEGLPTFQGPAGESAAMLEMYKRLQAAFDVTEARVQLLRLSERGSWSVKLDDGAQIELGRGEIDEVVARTQRFLGTLNQVTAHYGNASLETADLRYPQGYAVHLRGMSTLPDASKPHQNR